MRKLDDIRRSDGRAKRAEPTNEPQQIPQTVKSNKVVKRSRFIGKTQPIPQIKKSSKRARPGKGINGIRWFVYLVWRKKIFLALMMLMVIIGAGLAVVFRPELKKLLKLEDTAMRGKKELEQIVITEDTELRVDFSFNLKMVINDQPQAIPANYGKTGDERMIFNTDTSSGDIHVQSPEKESYILHDFFVLWGSKFNKSCLLNHCHDGSGFLTMTVNDKSNGEFDKYVIQPDDKIVIKYTD